jgi:hypothetical protein
VAQPPSDSVSSLSFSPKANYLVATSWDNQVCSVRFHFFFFFVYHVNIIIILITCPFFAPLFNSVGCNFVGKMLGDNAEWGCCRQYTQGFNIS